MNAVMQRLIVVVVAAAAAGCATMEVSSYAGGTPFPTASRTYAWGDAQVQPTGDPRLDNNEFFAARVQAAVDRELSGRGWTKAAGPPDVLVHFHFSVVEELMFSGAETETGYCADCRPVVYDSGTLLIDLVDAADERLIWRGWANGNVSGLVDNQRWLNERVDQAVIRIFEKWPTAF